MKPPRFNDFDSEPARDTAADRLAIQGAEAKRNAIAFLRQRYNLEDDEDPYYLERTLVRLAGTGVRAVDTPTRMRVVDLDGFEIGLPATGLDWHPQRILKQRGFDADKVVHYMAGRVRDMKLNLDYRHSTRFEALPVPYPEALQHCEINDTVRISLFDRAARAVLVERSCYLDQLATNINCDDIVDGLGGQTFREVDLDPERAQLRPFEFAVQANTIGVACVFVDRQNRPILRMRRERQDGRSLSIMKLGLHCPASGVLEWKHVVDAAGRVNAASFAHGVLRGMTEEIFDECKISPAMHPYEIAVLEFARELPRAGKPQFFLIARFPMLREELSRMIHDKRQEASKPNEWYEFGDHIDYQLPRRSDDLKAGQISRMTYEGFGCLIALRNALPYIEKKAFDFRPASDFFEARA